MADIAEGEHIGIKKEHNGEKTEIYFLHTLDVNNAADIVKTKTLNLEVKAHKKNEENKLELPTKCHIFSE